MSVVRRTASLGACMLAFTPLMTLPITPASASAPTLLRIVGTTASALQTNVVVAVPRELANQALPASAFSMQQGGRTVPIKVQRVSATALDVYVVVDAAGTDATVMWHKSAAADLLRQFPASVRTSVVTSTGEVLAPQQGNEAALRTLAAVQPRLDSVVDTSLNRVANAASNRRKQLIVLLSACPQDSDTDLTPLKTALASGLSQLDVIGYGSSCSSRLLPLAHDRGGLTLLAAQPNQLAAAVDTIAYDTLGQYWLSTPAPVRPTRVVVSVDFAGVRAANQLQLPTAATGRTTDLIGNPPVATSRPPTASARGNNSNEWRLRVLLALVAASILIAEVVAAMQVTAGSRPRLRLSAATKLVRRRRAPTSWVVTGAVASVPLADQTDVTVDTANLTPEKDSPTAMATEPAWDEAASGDPATEPTVATYEPMPRRLSLPPSGLSDGNVRVRVPATGDARALRDFAESVGGLAGVWSPPADANGADDKAVIESWLRTWGGEHPARWSWPSSSSAGRESTPNPGAAHPIAPPRPSAFGRGLGLLVERTEEEGMIGYVGVREKPHAVEVSYGTLPPFIGQDYTRRAVQLVTHWLTTQEPVRLVQTVILPSDNVSRSVARDVGFVPAGTVWTFVPATGMMALSVCFEFDPAGQKEEVDA